MSLSPRIGHLSPDEIQEFLEGGLSARQEAWVRGHLDVCPRCREEVQEWQGLFADLGGLGELVPREGFSEGVLARLRLNPSSVPRKGWWFLRLGPRRRVDTHLSARAFQEYLEGRLGRRAQERAEAHLAACSPCREEMRRWRRLWADLADLGHLSPSPQFAEGVLLRLRARSAEAPAPAPSPWPSIVRGVGRAQRLLPRSPRGWAVAGGLALAPALVATALAWAVFSHPLVSVETVLTYLLWKTSSALAGALAGAGGGFFENPLVAGLYSLFQGVARAPWLLGVGSFLFSLGCAVSVWLLHRQFTSPRESRRHAHVPS